MTLSTWPHYAGACCLALAMICCQPAAQPRDSLDRELASTTQVPLTANRVGVPITGSASASTSSATEEEPEEPKDYWASITFDRSNFEEVRNFVRERYIEAAIDDSRAYSQAAAFALASDEAKAFLLFPTRFYDSRKDHADEEGLLQGKAHRLTPKSKYVILEEVPRKDHERKRLTDDEIRDLRAKDRARTQELDSGWLATKFSVADFNAVMAFAAKSLGKDKLEDGSVNTWSVKKAWVAATQGYLYSLDPHSSLIAKQAWEDSTRELTDSSFEGIGAVLTRRPDSDYTIVESPLEGQPAVAAGLRAGDVIIEVDKNSIKGELLPKVVSRIRGPKGTQVVLTVERVGEPKPLAIKITRSRIEMTNIRATMVPGHQGLGRIKINGFVPTTEEALVQAFMELSAKSPGGKLRGLVMDLRNNSGGLLRQGINVADRFLKKGVVVSVKNRGEADEVYRADPGKYWGLPLVVLVNDGSASASEIVASAIQDNGRGVVLGDRTFGKASVQTLFSPLLRDDYYIKLSVARYYRPSGDTLQVVGVRPDGLITPDFAGKMPLGFREENLSNHLAPIESDDRIKNPANSEAVQRCVQASGTTAAIHKQDPNPAVKFDNQLMIAADYLECMKTKSATRGR
jgi:C-terminal peptidase prc